jgi:hypothetical protein
MTQGVVTWGLEKLTPEQFALRMGQRQLALDRSNILSGIDSGQKRWNVAKGTWEETGAGRNGRESGGSATGGSATGGLQSLGANNGSFNFQTGTFGDLTKQAKELAEFNLGLNQRQGEFDFDKRNKEFDANTGRQMRVNEQQNKWQSDLNRETQEAQTKRLGLQIEGQDRQQRTGIDQENFATDRAVRLASRRLGQS